MELNSKKRVVVFSGSKTGNNEYNELAEELGKKLADSSFITVNGGGPGLMDLVAKGAFKAKGEVIGVHFELEGREPSKFNTETFNYKELGPRQQKVISLADAFVVLPGGLGTIYELFEVLAKKHLQEIDKSTPVVLLSVDFWNNFLEMIEVQISKGFMSEEFLKTFVICDTVDEVILNLK